MYLVSSQANVNLTVSSGPAFLSQESGSTVKHLNWPLPNCLVQGLYNVRLLSGNLLCQTDACRQLTVYESAHINNVVRVYLPLSSLIADYVFSAYAQAYFSITPILINVANSNVNKDEAQCQSNALQPQPQLDSSPVVNPFVDPNSGVNADSNSPNASPSPTIYTITVDSSGLPSAWTIESNGSPTGTPTDPVTTVTAVLVSEEILTKTLSEPGTTSLLTTSCVLVFEISDCYTQITYLGSL